MLNFIKKFFNIFKEPTNTNPSIKKSMLPEIDPRKPIVESDDEGLIIQASPREKEIEDKISRSCAVCKYALHDPDIQDDTYVMCILKQSEPRLKKSDDTCLQHEPKYKNLKIILDKGTLLEYDSETVKPEKAFMGDSRKLEDGIIEIGENEWEK